MSDLLEDGDRVEEEFPGGIGDEGNVQIAEPDHLRATYVPTSTYGGDYARTEQSIMEYIERQEDAGHEVL